MLKRQCNIHEVGSDDMDKIKTPQSPTTPDKSRQKSLREGLKEIFKEFCSNTSIHGFQYFGQQRPWKEIIFWIVVFLITNYFCISIIIRVYIKWYETPVIVSFSEKSTPIWSIPFPAVTICPETKRAMNKTNLKYGHLLEKLLAYIDDDQRLDDNFTSPQLQETLALMHICRSEIDGFFEIPPLKNASFDYVQKLNEMLPNFEKYFYQCKWFGNGSKCSEIFTKIYTDGGICYTFNSLQGSDLYRENVIQHQMSLGHDDAKIQNKSLKWSLEKGYMAGRDLQTYPARVLSSGSEAGFQMYIQSFLDEVDYTCNGAVQGYKVLLHSPDDVPSVSKHFVRISMDKEILIAVKPKMITTSADIAAYDPDKRRCYMNKDRQLRFYKVYSQNNCERECLTNFTLSQCGCVRFSMPRTSEMPICGADKIRCYRHAKEGLLLKQFTEGLEEMDSTYGTGSGCKCMPACTSLDYETEISEGSFDLVNTLRAFESFDDYNKTFPGGKMSLMLIYFKENQFITSRRSEMYGVTELLANFGGVFGLFMGVSILSLVEMFYHCSLRLWSNMTQNRDMN